MHHLFFQTFLFVGIASLIGAFPVQASQIWNSLDGSTRLAARFHLTEEAVEQNQGRFPSLFALWRTFPEKFRDELQNSEPAKSDQAQNALQEIQQRYGFAVDSFLHHLRGEMGLAVHSPDLVELEDLEPTDLQMLIWLTPDQGTQPLSPPMRSFLEVEMNHMIRSSSERSERTETKTEAETEVIVEETEFMGHPALYMRGHLVSSEWQWQGDDANTFLQVTSYRPIQLMMVTTPEHILIEVLLHLNQYDTTTEIAYQTESFAYLGRTLHNIQSEEKEFLRKFAANPAFQRTPSASPVCEVAVDTAYFVEWVRLAHQAYIHMLQEEGAQSGMPPFVLKLLTTDWLEIIGLPLAKTFYAAADFTPKGGELYAALEGDFASPNQNNLLKIMLEPADDGPLFPTWVSADAQNYGSTSLNIRKIYDYLQEQLTLRTGSAWTTFIAMQEPLIRQSTGFGLAEHFHSFGSHLYTFSLQPLVNEDDAESPPFVPQVFLMPMKSTAPIHALIQLTVQSGGGQITPQQRQGFTVWSFEDEAQPEPTSLFYNNEYLILSNAESLTEQLIHQISQTDASPSAFFQRDDIRTLLQSLDTSNVSSLNIASVWSNSLLYQEAWSSLVQDIKSLLPSIDLLSFRMLFYSVQCLFEEGLMQELGAGINSGRLEPSGYLIHSIQTARTQDQ